MIQLERQAALCHPISLGTKNKLQRRRRTSRNLRYNGGRESLSIQANLLIHIHVKPLQPILHTNHPPLTVMALSQGFYGFSPVEK